MTAPGRTALTITGLLFAGIAAAAIAFLSPSAHTGVLGGALLLVAPGAVLMGALGLRVRGLLAVTLAMGLSVAVAVVVSVALAASPVGLSTRSLAAAMLVVLSVSGVVWAVRDPHPRRPRRGRSLRLTRTDGLQLAAAALLATGALGIAIASVTPTTAGPALLLAAAPDPGGLGLTVRGGGWGALDCVLAVSWDAPAGGGRRVARWDLDLPDPGTWQGHPPAEATAAGSTLDVMLECASPAGPLVRSLRLAPTDG